MTYLPHDEVFTIFTTAKNQVSENNGYRFGQALWNLLPTDLAIHDLENTPEHYKFYNSNDEQFCIEYFLKNYTTNFDDYGN